MSQKTVFILSSINRPAWTQYNLHAYRDFHTTIKRRHNKGFIRIIKDYWVS